MIVTKLCKRVVLRDSCCCMAAVKSSNTSVFMSVSMAGLIPHTLDLLRVAAVNGHTDVDSQSSLSNMSSFERRQCPRNIKYRGGSRATVRVLYPARLHCKLPRWLYRNTHKQTHIHAHTPEHYVFKVAIKRAGWADVANTSCYVHCISYGK